MLWIRQKRFCNIISKNEQHAQAVVKQNVDRNFSEKVIEWKKRNFLKSYSQVSKNISFRDFVSLTKAFGFILARTQGSHHIFQHIDISELVNIQNVREKAKPYQIKQFLELVEKYNLPLGGKKWKIIISIFSTAMNTMDILLIFQISSIVQRSEKLQTKRSRKLCWLKGHGLPPPTLLIRKYHRQNIDQQFIGSHHNEFLLVEIS